MMKSKNILLFVAISILTVLQSCDTRREIYPEEGVWVVVNLDWQNLPSSPNGATVIFYPQTRSAEIDPVVLKTNYTCDSTYLKRDNYSIVVFNETTASLSNILFKNADAAETIEAYISEVTNTPTSSRSVTTGGEPDNFAIDHYDDLEISRYSVLEKQRYELFFTPQLVTKNVQVTLYIEGIENLATNYTQYLVIDGMNYGVMLSSGEMNGEETSHFMTFSERFVDEAYDTEGYLRGNFNCFGRTDIYDNEVTVYLKLRDGSDYNMVVDATDIIFTVMDNTYQYYLNLNIDLPWVEDADLPGTGFDAEVDEWDDEETVEVPII